MIQVVFLSIVHVLRNQCLHIVQINRLPRPLRSLQFDFQFFDQILLRRVFVNTAVGLVLDVEAL